MRRSRLLVALLAALSPVAVTIAPTDAALRALPGTACTVFPSNNWWHADVSLLPLVAGVALVSLLAARLLRVPRALSV